MALFSQTNLVRGLVDQLVLGPLLRRVSHQPRLRELLLHELARDQALADEVVADLDHGDFARGAQVQEPGGLGLQVDVVGVEPEKTCLELQLINFQCCIGSNSSF